MGELSTATVPDALRGVVLKLEKIARDLRGELRVEPEIEVTDGSARLFYASIDDPSCSWNVGLILTSCDGAWPKWHVRASCYAYGEDELALATGRAKKALARLARIGIHNRARFERGS